VEVNKCSRSARKVAALAFSQTGDLAQRREQIVDGIEVLFGRVPHPTSMTGTGSAGKRPTAGRSPLHRARVNPFEAMKDPRPDNERKNQTEVRPELRRVRQRGVGDLEREPDDEENPKDREQKPQPDVW